MTFSTRQLKHFAMLIGLLAAGSFMAGCATNTVESRKQEKYAAYEALSPEARTAVDQRQIRIGMPMDAVYIAWGKPGEVVEGENEAGHTVTWVYYDYYLQDVYYSGYRRPHTGYYSTSYVRAQVIFTNGVVKQWQTFPAPGY
jgi:hypothetical protein